MKRYASILAVLVLLLGLAALSYAAPAEIPSDTTAVIAKGKIQITLGGDLRVRGMYGSNLQVKDENWYGSTENIAKEYYLDPKDGQIKTKTYQKSGENTSYYEYRVRLNLEAKVSPNTTGYIELESGDFNSDDVTWGSKSGGAKGSYPFGSTKESYVTIRQAWVQYQGSGLLGVPAGLKVGRQLIKLGYGLFLDHTYGDDAILVFVQPLKELTIGAATIKFREGSTTLSDDANGYVLLGAYKGKGFGLSADITYIDDQGNGNSSYKGFANAQYGANADAHLWNFGLRGNVDDIAGTGLNFRADVESQTGKIVNVTSGSKEPKFKGWAALAGLDYKFKTIPLSLTAEYAIGSGDDENSDDIKAFITALADKQNYAFVYEYRTPSACNAPFNSYTPGTGLCNTQYVKFGGAYDITKDIKAELYGYGLRAHKAVAINNGYEKDKDLGWEVDAKVTYQIGKGLKYWVEGGYFWPGDAYKLPNGKDADDAWAVRHGIQLKF